MVYVGWLPSGKSRGEQIGVDSGEKHHMRSALRVMSIRIQISTGAFFASPHISLQQTVLFSTPPSPFPLPPPPPQPSTKSPSRVPPPLPLLLPCRKLPPPTSSKSTTFSHNGTVRRDLPLLRPNSPIPPYPPRPYLLPIIIG